MSNISFKTDMANYLITISYAKLVKHSNFDRSIEMNYPNKAAELYDKACSISEVNLSFMFHSMFFMCYEKEMQLFYF